MTASPAELTLMLYEGAIKFCNIAEQAVEERDIQKAHNNIRKVQNIIHIYDYLSKRLVEANVKKDKEILEEINMHLHSVRDNWKEVMRINREKGAN